MGNGDLGNLARAGGLGVGLALRAGRGALGQRALPLPDCGSPR